MGFQGGIAGTEEKFQYMTLGKHEKVGMIFIAFFICWNSTTITNINLLHLHYAESAYSCGIQTSYIRLFRNPRRNKSAAKFTLHV